MREFVARRKARRRREGVRRWLAARKLQTHTVGDWINVEHSLLSVYNVLTRGHLARLRVQCLRQRRIMSRQPVYSKMWRGYLTRTKVTLQRSLEGALSITIDYTTAR
ncbi:hypothetical protein GQ600_18669 [Phytophthora cactorum]|nr:hypothetical protein GQ600_18669 [Phytophthora cactorum]